MPEPLKYRYRATKDFWENFYALSPEQKASVRRAWQIFKTDPFDARLGTHRINRLSAHYRRTIFSVRIEADLRVTFFLEGDWVCTIDIGTHDIYKS